MQSIKVVMREIGDTPNAISPADLDEYIKYQLTSEGYEIWKQVEGEIRDQDGRFLGYRLLFTFVKEEEPVKSAKAK